MRRLKDLGQNELEELVNYVRELRGSGKGYSEITRIVFAEKGITVSRATVLRWCKGKHEPFNKIKLVKLEPSPHLSYVIGVYFGDGSIGLSEHKYRIRLKVVDREFAEAFARALEDIGANARVYVESDGRRDRFVAEATSKFLYMFLKQPKEALFEVAKEYPQEFLRGFFDSEGCFNFNKNERQGFVSASNYNREVLTFCQKALESLGISSKIVLTKRKGTTVKIWGKEYQYSSDLYEIRIYRKDDLSKFYRLIGFTISRKQKLLEEYLGIHKK